MPTTQELSEETIIQRNETKFLASALGAEIVMMNTDNGDYIGVNSVGSDVWNLLIEPIRIDDLIKKITELYDVTKINSGNFILDITEFDFDAMIQEAIDVVQVLQPVYISM